MVTELWLALSVGLINLWTLLLTIQWRWIAMRRTILAWWWVHLTILVFTLLSGLRIYTLIIFTLCSSGKLLSYLLFFNLSCFLFLVFLKDFDNIFLFRSFEEIAWSWLKLSSQSPELNITSFLLSVDSCTRYVLVECLWDC